MPVPKNSKTTCNPKVIRRWVKARGGRPARRITKSGTAGSIRIELPGYRLSYPVEGILWDEFFRIFKEKDLVFLYQEKTVTGKTSLYSRLISRKFAGQLFGNSVVCRKSRFKKKSM